MTKLLHKELSDQVLGACFTVHTRIGPGLAESAYEACCAIELNARGLSVERQVVYPLHYNGELAAAYVADIVVEGKIILELKSVRALLPVAEAQLINYLRLSKVPVGYLVNFYNTSVEWRRRVVTP